jgi:putative thioredoxin
VAVVKGQPVPLFEGALPEEQIRAFIDELLKVAEANGVTERSTKRARQRCRRPAPSLCCRPCTRRHTTQSRPATTRQPPLPTARHSPSSPPMPTPRPALAQVELMQRVEKVDAAQIRAAGAEQPDNLKRSSLWPTST